MMSAARFLAVFSLFFVASVARAEPTRRVYVGTYLHDVTAFDQRSGTYEVDMDVWVKWLGEFDAAELRLQNAAGDVTREDLGEAKDGEWHSHRYRVRGTLRSEFPLHRFPFDDQRLVVVFELPTRRAELVPDLAGSGMSTRFSITGWNYDPHFTPTVARVVYTSDLGTFEDEGRATNVRRVAFGVTLHRPKVTIAVKLFLPLVLLLVIAMIALYLGPELVDPRAGIGVTVLLACFAFQFTIAGTIPDVAYLTIVDSLFIVAYALTTALLIITVVVYWLHRNGRPDAAIKVDRVFRVLVPVVAIAASAAILRAPDPRAHAHAPPRAAHARPRSERGVIHIGTLQLATVNTSVLRGATAAALVRVEPDGTRTAELAEEAPDVANAMLHFGADGTLEVHWRLREDLRWSDGHALTSDDFRFALQVSPDPHVTAIETPDPRTLVIRYEDVLASALEGLAPLPRHRLADTFRTGGFDAVREARRTTILPSAGAYRIAEFHADDRAVAEANPRYVGAQPSIRRIELRRFEDVDAMTAAFRAGEIDLIVPNTLSPEQASAVEAAAPGSLHQRPSRDLLALTPDLTVPLLSRLSVRRAIVQALDRANIAREAYGELGYVALSPVPGIPPDPNAAQPFDVVAARAALESENAIGATIRIIHSPRPMERRIAAALERHLEEIGLVVELVERAQGQGANANTPSGGLVLSTIRNDDDVDPRRFWNLERHDGRFDDRARTAAYDDSVAGLMFRYDRALYGERRSQLRDMSAEQVAARLPLLPILFTPEIVVANPALVGWDRGERFGNSIADWTFGPGRSE